METPDPPPSSGRLRLTVAYDGGPFRGWQSQARGETVQDHIEAAVARVCQVRRTPVHGSGRTDAGVHANGQVAHVDVPDVARHTPLRWRGALNAQLPPQIRVKSVRVASNTFHARYSALGKIYRYRIWHAAVLTPFQVGRAWHFPSPLDPKILAEAALLLSGTHDFAGFSANRGHPPETTVRTIHRIDCRTHRRLLTIDFEGSGFLYKMVRLLTGSMIRCAQGRARLSWLEDILAGRAKTSFAAPAHGLYLRRVLYAE